MVSNRNIGIVFLLFLFLGAAPVLHAQDLDKKISIKATNQSLEEVIKQLGEKGGIRFSYSPQTLPLSRKISINERNISLRKAFEIVFTANGIDYIVSEKQVILKPAARENVPTTVKPAPAHRFTISGYVRDKSSGEAIIGAIVYDAASQQGTATNAYGFYSLSLLQGSYFITTSYIGYSPVSQAIDLNKNQEMIVELRMAAIEMKVIEITSQESDVLHLSQAANLKLSPSVLKQIPGFAGNIDVIKSLQNVPGIVSFGDGSSFFYVRGGNSDQNLLLLDEAPIYNPSHLFGFFSALAPDAIKDVSIYKGDFPANYGGRLSSVVDVHAREGNLKRLGFSGNLGPYTTDVTLEGPIAKEKSSFLVSARKSNLNWLQSLIDDNRSYNLNFYDLNAKLNVRLNSKNRLYFTFFKGQDDFERINSTKTNTFGISWNNTAGTLRWNHTFNNRLFSNTTAYISRYNYFLDISKERLNYWTSSITNATLKTDISWFPNPDNTVKAGFELNSHNSNPGKMYYADKEIPASLAEYHCTELAVYASNEQQLGERFFARYGLRFSRWNDLGPTTVYFFNSAHSVIDTVSVAAGTVYKSFNNFEPRASIKFAVNQNTSLQCSYNHNVQYLQVISNSTSPFTSLEVWVPSGPNIKPQQSDQIAAGFFSKLMKGTFEFSLEAYYKRMHNQIDYTDHADMLINQLIEGELRFGSVNSYGIEALLRKSKGRFTGWVSYAWSRSLKTIEGVNGGREFPASWDRPHTVGLTMAWNSGKRWSFSSRWIYLSGAPFSSPTGFYYVNGYTLPVFGQKHNDRYPDYHRLDVSAAFALSKPEKRFQHHLILTIYNAYGRRNPFALNFNKMLNDNGKIAVPANLEGDVELITTSISVAGAIPSLNYTFRF